MPRAADVLVECLKSEHVDRVFCVPGESYLAVIDALVGAPEIDVVNCRHEGGGGFMAVADSKATGRAGVLFVSRGPGAMHAAIGIHVAEQDAAPLVLFVGQVAREDLGRHAFQEVDYLRAFDGMVKWAAEVRDAATLPEVVNKAFHIAQSATPGPVVVSLPEDMLSEDIKAPVPAANPVAAAQPSSDDVTQICERIAVAERPLLIAGGIMGAEGRASLRAVSETWNLPVALSFRRQDLFDNTHPNFACHLAFNMPPVFAETLNEADLVVAVGTRLGDVTTQGYRIPKAPTPDQPLIHVHPDEAQLGRVFETDLKVAADANAVLAAIAKSNAPPAPDGRANWIERVHALAAERMAWTQEKADDGVIFGSVVAELGARADADAVLTLDAGNFSTWVHRHFPFKATNLMLAAVAGSMGMGVPAAVAGSLRFPDRQVLCFVGDGGFQMTGNELAVAVERKLPIRVFVSRNGSYGTIRLYQEKLYEGRAKATDLGNPDFKALADAYGATGLRIETDDDVGPVVAQALATDGPVLVEVCASLEYLSAYARISQLRGG